MLMSPDSSHNSSPPSQPSSQPTSVIRLQVQECTSNWNGGNTSVLHVNSNHRPIQAPPPPPPPPPLPIPTNYLNNSSNHHHHNQRTFVYNQHQSSHYSNISTNNNSNGCNGGDMNNKKYPLMDTTVASSVKGEPELNIGNFKHFFLKIYSLSVRYSLKKQKLRHAY